MVPSGKCAGEIYDMIMDVFNAAVSYATIEDDPMEAIENTIDVVKAFDFPVCSWERNNINSGIYWNIINIISISTYIFESINMHFKEFYI